ncbi:MAG TPA: PAS domain-containing sensor histidine kinase [Archangium sp.]|uniref:PAS domain-containing sensor histidine kinase n=1 Tax=Archangium sp. TaxID=1872627 RepID=UPI002E313208|nr:PAS domain-containing sensor histidine kinase [Archangium sp.]HEX5753295.1 PAS domain-containing sensor histidine kinase [Archangium sp.]
MTLSVDSRISTLLLRLASIAASIGVLVGAVVLVGGWGFGVEDLTVLVPGMPAMVPGTAAGLMLTGTSLGLLCPASPSPLRRGLGRVCAALASLLGVLVVADYVFHQRWLDGLFVWLTPLGAGPRLPSPQTALCFILLGLALVLLDVETPRGRRPAQYLALTVALLSWTALIGYGTGASQLHTLPGLPAGIGMALHTCTAFFVLSLGTLGARPTHGLMRTLTGTHAGSVMVRRLLPPLLLGPYVVGHLSLLGTRAGLYSSSTAFALVTGMLTFMGLPFLWSASRRLNHAGLALEEAWRTEALQRAWLMSIIEQMPDGVLILDEQGHILVANAAAKSLCVSDSDGVDAFGNRFLFELRRPSGEPLPWEEVPFVRAVTRGELEAGVELSLWTRDGRSVPVLVSATPIQGRQGTPGGAVSIFRDITPLKELERQREEWTSVVAHDLRQPVSVIALALDALRNDTPEGPPAGQQEPLQWIDTSVGNLRRMIEDLLDASRIEARQLRLERQPVSLTEHVHACVRRMEGQARGRPIRVTAPDEALTLGDPLRIDQVITNLLSNAVKYGTPQTPIEVEVTRLEEGLRVSVTNEGPGIPPEQLPQLFRRFHRTPGSHKQAAGIGLGLYICKGLVEAHGGRLWATSTPGRRTTFCFSLPELERAGPSSLASSRTH